VEARDHFREEIERLKKGCIGPAVAKLQAEGKDPNDWLKTLYTAFLNRMLSDNERIWRTGAILVPLSLSAFAALAAMRDFASWKVLVLGSASSALLWCWLIIAENHRAFQQKSEAWLVAIQETVGFERAGGPKVQGNALNRVLIFSGAVQWMRWGLAVGVTAAWLVLWWLAASGRLTSGSS
jgi:hypothetical protein